MAQKARSYLQNVASDVALIVWEKKSIWNSKLLLPLGKPAANAPKYFAAVDVVACSENRDWLSRGTRTISSYWAQKNAHKKLKSVTSDSVAV